MENTTISFTLNDAEEAKYQEFKNKMFEKLPKYHGAIGGAVSWRLTYTSVGTVIVVIIGGEECDITDYGCW